MIIETMNMTTYVLSEHISTWEIHRYDENITSVASKVPSEEEAFSLAVKQAKETIPSQILRISFKGECRVVGVFEEDQSYLTPSPQ